MVEVTVIWRGQSIRIITVHWKSRREGAADTRPARAREAEALQRRMTMLEQAGAHEALLVLGDFNTDATELTRLSSVLDDLWSSALPEQSGSYVHRGRWQSPDRVLVSADLTDGAGLDILPRSFRVFAPSFMTEPGSGHPLRGGHGGWRYSDHLPILVELVTSGLAGGGTRRIQVSRHGDSEDQRQARYNGAQ
jgi:hypothetical protein